MYETVRNELKARLSSKYDTEDIDNVLGELDNVMLKYDMVLKETSIVQYKSDIEMAAEMYIACKKAAGLGENSLNNMRYKLRGFCLSMNKPLKDITANDIRGYLYMYRDTRSVKKCTIESIRNTIGAFFDWAVVNEYIENDPSLKVEHIKAEKPHRGYLTEEELEYMRRACVTERERALVEVLYSTGARIHEIASLDRKDVDLENGRIAVLGKGSEYYTVYLNAKAKVYLKAYLDSRSDNNGALFVRTRSPHTKVTSKALRECIEKIGSRAGIRRTVCPHMMRHTMATMALRNGAKLEAVQKMLNHKSPNTTQIYAEMMLNDVEAVHMRTVI